MPYSQIAQIMEISEETARWRVCKARQLLVEYLRSYLDRPNP
jgi:DNA-directed RNA polymerase specialized sigma24 family protein